MGLKLCYYPSLDTQMKNSLISRKLTEIKATTPAQHLGIS